MRLELEKKRATPLDLHFGSHDLKVFSQPRFAKLSLGPASRDDAPIERRTSWELFHEGRMVSVAKRTGEGGALMHVLRDPAHKGNLLVLRKDAPTDPFGMVTLFTHHPNGDEWRVGECGLESAESLYRERPDMTTHLRRDPTAVDPRSSYLYSLGVVPYSLRKPTSKHPDLENMKNRLERLDEQLLKIRSDLAMLTRLRAVKIDEINRRRKALLGRMDEIEQNLYRFPIEPARPSGRTYSYRSHRLGDLLVTLVSELAQRSGKPVVEAHFDKRTTGRFMPKRGWQVLGDDGEYLHCRKMFSGDMPRGKTAKKPIVLRAARQNPFRPQR